MFIFNCTILLEGSDKEHFITVNQELLLNPYFEIFDPKVYQVKAEVHEGIINVCIQFEHPNFASLVSFEQGDFNNFIDLLTNKMGKRVDYFVSVLEKLI